MRPIAREYPSNSNPKDWNSLMPPELFSPRLPVVAEAAVEANHRPRVLQHRLRAAAAAVAEASHRLPALLRPLQVVAEAVVEANHRRSTSDLSLVYLL